MSLKILHDLALQIKKATFYSIMENECTDISNKEQFDRLMMIYVFMKISMVFIKSQILQLMRWYRPLKTRSSGSI